MITKQFPHSVFLRLLARCFLAAALALFRGGPDWQSVQAVGPLQALIDATPADGTVIMPAGTYTEYVVISSNLTLAGSPGATIIIQPPAGHPAIELKPGAAAVTLRNLTIQNASNAGGSGGAVYAANSVLFVDHCTFSNNSATYGGAIYLSVGSLSVSDSSILNNHATLSDGDGGGIFARGPLTLTNTLLKGNTAGRHGGGVHGDFGLVTVTGGSFESNIATAGNGGGLNMNDDLIINGTTFKGNQSGQDGGGLLQWNPGKYISLTNVTFADNTSKSTGGGMAAKGNMIVVGGAFLRNYAGDSNVNKNTLGGGLYLEGGGLNLQGTIFDSNETRAASGFPQGGGLFVANPYDNQVKDAVFSGNKSWLGGAIYKTKRDADTSYGSLTLLRSSFLNNSAGYGGAVETSNLTARDCLFDGNSADNQGGALALGGTSVLERLRFLHNKANYLGAKGSALYLTGNVTLRNSAFVGNYHTALTQNAIGSAVMLDAGTGIATLEHLTISNNTNGSNIGLQVGLQVNGGTVTMNNAIIANQPMGVCITGGTLSIHGVLLSGNGANYTGTGCASPSLVDHEISGNPAFAADGYHITAESAALNTAYHSLLADDLDGNPRPAYGQADLGADEYWVFRVRIPAVFQK